VFRVVIVLKLLHFTADHKRSVIITAIPSSEWC